LFKGRPKGFSHPTRENKGESLAKLGDLLGFPLGEKSQEGIQTFRKVLSRHFTKGERIKGEGRGEGGSRRVSPLAKT